MLISKIFMSVTFLHLVTSIFYGVLLVGECGLNRGGLLFLLYLIPMASVSWAFFTRSFENLSPMDRGFRGKITEGDVQLMKMIGPGLLLVAQCFLCIGVLYFTSDFLKNGSHPRTCEFRSRFR